MRLLKNSELPEVEARAKLSGIPLDTCPTCKSVETYDADIGWHRDQGTYRLHGSVYPCDCDRQIELRKHYLLANIPEQYQRLNWNDYDGSERAQEAVSLYLSKWEGFRANGMGIEVTGPQGTGKSFAVTHIGKELIKRGEKVFFIAFLDLIAAIKTDEALIDKAMNVPVLILDELSKIYQSDAQLAFFSEKLEQLIRHRTNWNLITLMTTNLTEDELHEYYPRVYSLLEAKQIRIEIDGNDARMSKIGNENLELSIHNEIRPIS